jgi:hypothetical protein
MQHCVRLLPEKEYSKRLGAISPVQFQAALERDIALADAFVSEYLEHGPMPSGFVELQRLYMLNLKLSLWEYWQREKGRFP